MWEPRRLTILWAFTAFYMDSFTCFYSLLTRSKRWHRWNRATVFMTMETRNGPGYAPRHEVRYGGSSQSISFIHSLINPPKHPHLSTRACLAASPTAPNDCQGCCLPIKDLQLYTQRASLPSSLQTKQVSELGEAHGLSSNSEAGWLLLQMTQKAVKSLSPVPWIAHAE
jgi:hypothetical protein